MKVTEVNGYHLAKRWFLWGTKRFWHVENYLADIPTSYTLWNTAHEKVRVRFKDVHDVLERLTGEDGEGHLKDIEDYQDRILAGEKTLPPILVQITAGGKRVVVNGNRRCAAIMLVPEESRKGIIIPADIMDEREKPY